jgi:flagellar basal-body rod protein FlgB
VSLEAQVTELAKNQSMHNMAIGLLSVQFRQLKAAISERVG